MASRDSFYPMATGEKYALLFLIVFSALSFLPPWRTIEVAGLALFGWLMALLMVLSPVLTLWVFGRGGRPRTRSRR